MVCGGANRFTISILRTKDLSFSDTQSNVDGSMRMKRIVVCGIHTRYIFHLAFELLAGATGIYGPLCHCIKS